jgi:transcriptional regulator with XRE-family HTH domain
MSSSVIWYPLAGTLTEEQALFGWCAQQTSITPFARPISQSYVARKRSLSSIELMTTRRNVVIEASHETRRRLDEVIRELRRARQAAGLSQSFVGEAAGCSRQRIGHLETGRITDPGPIMLSRYASVVGLELGLRAFPGGSPMRDAGQLATLARFRALIGSAWRVRTEIPIGGDRRSIDALLTNAHGSIAVECVTRLLDAQAQVRSILLKADAARVSTVLIVLADTRWNRRALVDTAPTLDPAFPLRRRVVLRCLRTGEVPTQNGLLLV